MAAASGVELKRKKVSFPVGKDEQRNGSLDFYEFTQASAGETIWEMSKEEFDPFREIPSYIAEPMRTHIRNCITSSAVCRKRSERMLIPRIRRAVDTVLDRIIRDLHNDFAHHAEPKDIVRIGWIWIMFPNSWQRITNKFVFSHVREGTRASDLEDALQWLVDAGLVYRLEMAFRSKNRFLLL